MTKPYHILIAPAAQRQIKTMATKHQKLIVKVAEGLCVNPRPPGSKKVEGMIGLYSESMNNYRLIYRIEDPEILILLIK